MRERAADGSILKFSYSSITNGADAAAKRGSSRERVLPLLQRPSSSGSSGVVDVNAAAAAGGFMRPRLFAEQQQEEGGECG